MRHLVTILPRQTKENPLRSSIIGRRALPARSNTQVPEDRVPGASYGPVPSAAVKRVTAVLVLISLATSTGACAAGSVGSQPSEPVMSSSVSTEAVASIVGTRWRVKSSEGTGDAGSYADEIWTFQPDGVLERESTDPNESDGVDATWSRVGSNIQVEIGRYSYWDGELKGKVIVGKGDNIADETWAWEARQQ